MKRYLENDREQGADQLAPAAEVLGGRGRPLDPSRLDDATKKLPPERVAPSPPLLSIVVPTRNESQNLPVLLRRLAHLDVGGDIEVIVVDDSDDDTAGVGRRCAAKIRRPSFSPRIVHRDPAHRAGGLSGAVVDGMRAATGTYVCVMDADLQHPPELIPDMLGQACGRHSDVVVASRYARGGSSAGLDGAYRRSISRGARATTRLMLPASFRGVTDPMSGFFLVRREAIDLDRMRPRGFKILVEVLGRHPGLRASEVAFEFGTRLTGTSKASTAQGLELLRQLGDLRAEARHARRPRPRKQTFRYDIHGIICVESARSLPELEKFEVDELRAGPVIRVGIRLLRGLPRGENIDLTGSFPVVSFVERMGFGIRVEIEGEEIRVEVTPSVARSPHVLYTNVVEPLLRWRLVESDHALVHAACIADGDDAYLVTARTDTGKTTTMLKVLDKAPLAFLSDDLVVIDRNGTILTYPKPLTISAHTVHALRQTDLTRFEHLKLIPQSRLHSREGRQLAFLLARYRLPVASISAMMQRIVPPPKYHVERLVPGVKTGRSATARAMYIIERGGTGGEVVEPGLALETLLSNCADAFGFPPYESLERLVLSMATDDLASLERSIIAEAMSGVPTELVRSETLDWADRIADAIAANAADVTPRVVEALHPEFG